MACVVGWRWWVCGFFVCVVSVGYGSEVHEYAVGDEVKVWANKMVPYRNPSESYPFFFAAPWPPDCVPQKMEVHQMRLGELLQGDWLVNTGIHVEFAKDKALTHLCGGSLTSQQVTEFRQLVANNYHYDLIVDELPIRLIPLGRVLIDAAPEVVNEVFIFTTLHFVFKHNGHNIIEADVMVGDEIEFEHNVGVTLPLRYTVQWTTTEISFENRMQRYYEQDRLRESELRMHWFSVVNAVASVFVLLVFLSTIFLRTVRRDFARLSADNIEDLDEDEFLSAEEERGWKIVKSDVFRFPRHKELFCAMVGTGLQVLLLLTILLVLAVTGVFLPRRRGSFNSLLLFSFALTSSVSGFWSSMLYAQMDGKHFALNAIASFLVFVGPILLIWVALDILALMYRSTMALSFSAVASLLSVIFLIAFPGTVIGAVFGRRMGAGGFNAPVRTSKVWREIPKPPFYLRSGSQMAIAGLLPFGAVMVELVYVFASVWGHKVYAVNGIIVLVLLIVVTVTAFVCTALTYYQLCGEDYEWWWTSVFNGGSTGVYLLLYSIFYLLFRSDLTGLLQIAFFFGYMTTVSYAVFLMLGSVGYFASVTFLRHMYTSIKCD